MGELDMSGKVRRLTSGLLSSAVNLAAERLLAGGVLAVPTDTIYGLTCLVQHQAAAESPLALTSANFSNMTSTLAVEEFQDLHSSLSLVFDGGRLSDSEEARLGSTVVDLSEEGTYTIIRQGSARHTVTSVMEQHGIKLR